MNRFPVFVALLAVACAFVVADEFPGEDDSQLSIMTTDDLETSQLKASNLEIFDDFCLKSRDHVFADIKHNSNSLSSRLFNLFFDSAESLGREALDVARTGNDRLSAQLANPDAQIAPASNGAESIIAQGQSNIQGNPAQPKALLEAFRASVSAISQSVGTHVQQRFEQLKSIANVGQLASALQGACAAIERYEAEIKDQFESYKANLAEQNPAIASLDLAEVPCVTSRRISRIDGICKFVAAAQPSVMKVIQTSRASRS